MIMNSKVLCLAIALTATLIGCTDSNKPVQELPPLVERLQFQYINNNTLYEFFPDTGESEAVEALFASQVGDTSTPSLASHTVSSPDGHIIYLDTDVAEEVEDEETGVDRLSHTLLPEFVAYTQDSTLFLFDLSTRRSHPISTYSNEDGSNSSICDIRSSTALDEENRLIGQILYKNLMKVYVKTAPEQCSEGPYSYFLVDLVENTSNTYDIRRSSLKEHNHISAHAHDHEGTHEHNHAYETGEIDENGFPFDPNNHAHSHIHTHGYDYGPLEEHLYLSKSELDEVHSATENIEIIYETNNSWVGRSVKTAESEMYAGYPIMKSDPDEIGYLGFNSVDNSYSFYQLVPENDQRSLLYTFSLNDIDNPSLDTSTARDTQADWFTYINNAILFRHGDALIKLPMLALFDDDQTEERIKQFTNPVYTFQTPDDSQVRYIQSEDLLDIRDGLKLVNVFNLSNNPEAFDISTNFTQKFEMFSTSSALLAHKFYGEDNTTSDFSESSLVKISGATYQAIESTVLPRTNHYLKIQYGNDDNLIVHGEISEEGIIEAQEYNADLTTAHFPAFSNSIWSPINNMTDDDGSSISQALINSVDTETIELLDREVPALKNANVYLYDVNNHLGQGDLIGTIPGTVAEVLSIDIKSDLHGEVKVKSSYETNAPVTTYFFPTALSFINPTGSFGDMKPMYDNSESTPSAE
jgi:hypothetical protein